MTTAGVEGYIKDVSRDPAVRSRQLWQYIASKVFFRLSAYSQGQYVCETCKTHTYLPQLGNIFCSGNTATHTSSVFDFPIQNISKDGYDYNYEFLYISIKQIIIKIFYLYFT